MTTKAETPLFHWLKEVARIVNPAAPPPSSSSGLSGWNFQRLTVLYEAGGTAERAAEIVIADGRNFDRVWCAIFDDPELEWARNKLSVYELKMLINRVLSAISQTPE